MKQIILSKAVIRSSPSFIAALAQLNLFRFKLIYGGANDVMFEIEFKENKKMPMDWYKYISIYSNQ